jgi:hypothetical protein
VERFLQAQAPGSVGLDVGCGNGKNLTVNKDVFIVASDRYVSSLHPSSSSSSVLVLGGISL